MDNSRRMEKIIVLVDYLASQKRVKRTCVQVYLIPFRNSFAVKVGQRLNQL